MELHHIQGFPDGGNPDDDAVILLAWSTLLLRHAFVSEEEALVARILIQTDEMNTARVFSTSLSRTLAEVRTELKSRENSSSSSVEGAEPQFGYSSVVGLDSRVELDMTLSREDGHWSFHYRCIMTPQPERSSSCYHYLLIAFHLDTFQGWTFRPSHGRNLR